MMKRLILVLSVLLPYLCNAQVQSIGNPGNTVEVQGKLRIKAIQNKSDIDNWKPAVVDSAGNIHRLTYWPASSQDSSTRKLTGEITNIAGYSYSTSLITYLIAGKYYSAQPTTFVIASSDSVFDRFTIIWGDINGTIGQTNGSAANPAVIPMVQAGRCLLATYYIKAGSTVPSVIARVEEFRPKLIRYNPLNAIDIINDGHAAYIRSGTSYLNYFGGLRFYAPLANTYDLLINYVFTISDLRYGKTGHIVVTAYDFGAENFSASKDFNQAIRVRVGKDSANGNRMFVELGDSTTNWAAAIVNLEYELVQQTDAQRPGWFTAPQAVSVSPVYIGTRIVDIVLPAKVTSVNGMTGAVVIPSDTILLTTQARTTLGLNLKERVITAPNTANTYWNGFKNFSSLNTDSITQGSSNLYFSNARAQSAMLGLYELPLTFSTGLTRSGNTITNNLSTGIAGGQAVIGGIGITDALTLKGTTGNGTLTSPAINMNVGNNGATNAVTILNNGNVGVGKTNAIYTLDVNGDTRSRQFFANDGYGYTLADWVVGGVSSNRMYIYNNVLAIDNMNIFPSTGITTFNRGVNVMFGNFGIGTTTPDAKLDVSNGAILSSSTNLNHYRNVVIYSSATSITGTMEITLPQGWTNTMMTMVIKGYDFSDAGQWEVHVSGYNYQGNTYWAAYKAEIIGSAPFNQVRLAYDTSIGKMVVLLGTISTAWAYPKVEVTDFVSSYSNITGWGSGWTIAPITSEGTITNVVTPILATYLSTTGNLGIGTTTPTAKLEVAGTAKINGSLTVADGTQGSGRVLTSDASGLASWQAPTPGTTTTLEFATAAASQTTFTFTAVPVSFADYIIAKNGVLLEPTSEFTVSSNTITIPSAVSGDKIRYQRNK